MKIYNTAAIHEYAMILFNDEGVQVDKEELKWQQTKDMLSRCIIIC